MQDELIKAILDIPEETQTLEFKRILGAEKLVLKVVETIVAMSNTDGGTIVFGVDDPEKTTLKGLDRVFGIEENKDLFDAIGREIQKIIPPIGDLWKPVLIPVEGLNKTIAILHVSKNTDEFRSFNNQVFIRQLKSNKRLTPQEIVKLSYAKGFTKADKELVEIDFDLLNTPYFKSWKEARKIETEDVETTLFNVGLARKDETGILKPTRAAVMLFAQYPTNLLDTKCAIRIFQYLGTIEKFEAVPNLVGTPKTIDGPLVKVIKEAQEHVLFLLRNGVEVKSGFVNKYRLPERTVKEVITNAVIHRDYHIKRDIEINLFEDRIEIQSPGLFPYNITKTNIGHVRADGYRNDLVVKHLREFPEQPNLDLNEGVRAMRSEMKAKGLYPPIFFTYPVYEDSVKVVLLNELIQTEWEKVEEYLKANKYISNKEAREITGVTQLDSMSKKLKKWVTQGLLLKIDHDSRSPRLTRYKLADKEDLQKYEI